MKKIVYVAFKASISQRFGGGEAWTIMLISKETSNLVKKNQFIDYLHKIRGPCGRKEITEFFSLKLPLL